MTKTIYDLTKRALRDRGILGATEEATALDHDHCKEVYEADLHELRDLEIAYWSDDAIPNEVFRAMASRLGLLVGHAFGYPRATEQELESSLKPFRKHLSKRHSGEPTQATYM